MESNSKTANGIFSLLKRSGNNTFYHIRIGIIAILVVALKSK